MNDSRDALAEVLYPSHKASECSRAACHQCAQTYRTVDAILGSDWLYRYADRVAAAARADERRKVAATMKDYRDRPVATLTGEVEESDTGGLRVWIVVLRDVDGEPGHFVLSLDSHTPAPPPEPEQPAVYVEDPPIRNVVWQPSGDRWWCDNRRISRDWPELVREFPGTVYVPREKGEDRD